MSSFEKHRVAKYLVSTLLILFFSLFFAEKINLTNADIGRHLKNGEIFIKEGRVVSNNFYSYTQPDFPVVNHHWFSGVIFYLIYSTFGFTGLSIFYTLLSGIMVFVFFNIAKRYSTFNIALFSTLLLLPLVSDRKEVRPEVFSYLLLGLYTLIFEKIINRELNLKTALCFLIPLQIFWVNSHLFFVLSLFISGIYTFLAFLKKDFSIVRVLLLVNLVLVFASLINPFFINGLLEPLNIFKEYGYQIIENSPLFFMQKISPFFKYFYVEFLTLVYLLLIINLILSKRIKAQIHLYIFVLAFLILSYQAIRGIPMFGMFLIPTIALFLKEKYDKQSSHFMYASIILALVLVSTSISKNFGLGLLPNNNKSAEFFKDQNIKGPIFNNYDIGGYLIYNLYGQEPVFVDNRPEAYSVNFFTDAYIPAQQEEKDWLALLEKHDFNVIYFYRLDATPWAQPFLIRRIQDSSWVPVFVDNYTLILVRNNEKNADIINNYALPKNYFVVI